MRTETPLAQPLFWRKTSVTLFEHTMDFLMNKSQSAYMWITGANWKKHLLNMEDKRVSYTAAAQVWLTRP